MSVSRLASVVLAVLVTLVVAQTWACGAVDSTAGTQSTGPGQIAVTTGTSLPAVTASIGTAVGTQDIDGTDLYPAPVGGKWGYINNTGTMVIEPRFGDAADFSQGLAPVRLYDGWRWGYIDGTGEFVIQPQFSYAAGFGEALLASVVRDDAGAETMGYVDKTGKALTGEPFDEAYPFSEGLGLVRRGEAYGYIDITGRIVIPFGFSSHAEPFSEGLAAVRLRMDAPDGFIDKTGTWVIEPRFGFAGSFSEGLAQIWGGAGYGFIDKTGTIVISPQFDGVSEFSEGLAVVSSAPKQGSGDGTDVFTTLPNENYGYIDTTGKLVIGGDFDYAWPFSDGRAAVEVGGKWGYIDKTGAWAIEPRFDNAYSFFRGLARVCLDGETGTWAYVDTTGTVIWESGPDALESHETNARFPPGPDP